MENQNGKATAAMTSSSQPPDKMVHRWMSGKEMTPDEIARWAARKKEMEEHDRLLAERKRQAQITATMVELAAALGSRYSPDRATFDGYKIYDARQKGVVAKLRHAAQLASAGKHLVLYGAVGTGKDHLLAAALYEVARAGFSVAWVAGLEFYGMVRDGFKNDDGESSIIGRLSRPRILGISDPTASAGDLSDWRIELLSRLIDQRYREMRPIWLTMNADNEQEIEEKLTTRIWDRLQDDAEIVPCFWPSHRARARRAG